MMPWTSPRLIVRSMPFRIWLPSIPALSPEIFSIHAPQPGSSPIWPGVLYLWRAGLDFYGRIGWDCGLRQLRRLAAAFKVAFHDLGESDTVGPRGDARGELFEPHLAVILPGGV